MARRLVMSVILGALLVTGVGCRMCDRNGRLFNRDWSSREKDREKPKADSGDFLKGPLIPEEKLIPSPGLPPTGGTDLPPVPDVRQRFSEPVRPERELLLPQGETPVAPRKDQPRAGGGLLGTPEALEKDRESQKTPLNTDLEGYTRVKSDIANGRLPTATGMEKLKSAGFTTIAYLHEPNANIDGVRRDAEAKGLKFISVPFGSGELADGMKAFTSAVTNRDAKPLYVCDDDGMRTGMAWYGHFRTFEFANDDAAKLLAAPLGLNSTSTGDRGTFWVAMQKYLANR